MVLADDTATQVRFGRAEVRLRAARCLLLDVLDEHSELASAGLPIPRAGVALVGLACAEAMGAAEQAVDTACQMIGSDSARKGSWLERTRRDMDTMRHHVLFSVAQPSLARQLAGIPTHAYPFLLQPIVG